MATMQRPREITDLFTGFNADADTRRKVVVCARELRKLAAKRGAFGVTAEDTRHIAQRFGYATGAELNHRALSWFATVPAVARLTRTERTRRNARRNSHRVYVL